MGVCVAVSLLPSAGHAHGRPGCRAGTGKSWCPCHQGFRGPVTVESRGDSAELSELSLRSCTRSPPRGLIVGDFSSFWPRATPGKGPPPLPAPPGLAP